MSLNAPRLTLSPFLTAAIFILSFPIFSRAQNLVLTGKVIRDNKTATPFLYYTEPGQPFRASNRVPIDKASHYRFDLAKTIYKDRNPEQFVFAIDPRADPGAANNSTHLIHLAPIRDYQAARQLPSITLRNDLRFALSGAGTALPGKPLPAKTQDLLGRYEFKNEDSLAYLELEEKKYTIHYLKMTDQHTNKEEGLWSVENGRLKLDTRSTGNPDFGTSGSEEKRVRIFQPAGSSCIPAFAGSGGRLKKIYRTNYQALSDTSLAGIRVTGIDFDQDLITATFENRSLFALGNFTVQVSLINKGTGRAVASTRVWSQHIRLENEERASLFSSTDPYTKCGGTLRITRWIDAFDDYLEANMKQAWTVEVRLLSFYSFK